mmetsp:Transcript_29218/g.59773  ORF Transcript_29218/g.59773 Transcript_29218/m.59773 type:complete len:403 (+) Transcript_29218:87-1295(+)
MADVAAFITMALDTPQPQNPARERVMEEFAMADNGFAETPSGDSESNVYNRQHATLQGDENVPSRHQGKSMGVELYKIRVPENAEPGDIIEFPLRRVPATRASAVIPELTKPGQIIAIKVVVSEDPLDCSGHVASEPGEELLCKEVVSEEEQRSRMLRSALRRGDLHAAQLLMAEAAAEDDAWHIAEKEATGETANAAENTISNVQERDTRGDMSSVSTRAGGVSIPLRLIGADLPPRPPTEVAPSSDGSNRNATPFYVLVKRAKNELGLPDYMSPAEVICEASRLVGIDLIEIGGSDDGSHSTARGRLERICTEFETAPTTIAPSKNTNGPQRCFFLHEVASCIAQELGVMPSSTGGALNPAQLACEAEAQLQITHRKGAKPNLRRRMDIIATELGFGSVS